MKRPMKVLLITVCGAAFLLAAGLFLYKAFVTDRIRDRGGMENPETGEDAGVSDGDQTHVDNETLLAVIVGMWESTDDRYTLTLDSDQHLALALDGEAVLDDELDFSALLPRPDEVTDFRLLSSNGEFRIGDGSTFATVTCFYHKAGRLYMGVTDSNGRNSEITFVKENYNGIV